MQHSTHRIASSLTVVAILAAALVVHGDELDVPLGPIDGAAPSGMMQRFLMRQAEQAIRRWTDEYEQRKTPEAIAVYQKRLREQWLKAIGGLPERTRLEPHVTGAVSRPGYRVEKILFQSRPKFYVTALLFLPDPERFKPPYPGVAVACGHWPAAKGADENQMMGALLALNGMAALVFDPIDQGERGQYLGPGGWPKLWGTAAHCNVGMGCVLLGQNTARFEIWDGMCAIDYLQSRPEIKPDRIGCTGSSGGGTQASYLMALDDRIGAAAPNCYITSTLRLLETIGMDDSEQQIFGQLISGPHEADMVIMRAPSPVLLCVATKDFFDIQGSWDTFRYAKRLYTRQGFSERVGLLENDAEHNYDRVQREGVARWMSRWLLDKDQAITEPPITLLTEQEYHCLPDGKVMTLPGARSVYDLNDDYENELAEQRAKAWSGGDRPALLEQVRRLAGVRKLSELPKSKVEVLEPIARPGYRIERLVIRTEEGIVLPALLFLPEKPKTAGVVLYVHEKGKAADADAGGPIERRVQAGESVLAVDLRGTGQTQSISRRWGGPEHQDSYLAYMLGRSCVGMWAEDILVCARYAADRVAGGRDHAIQLVVIGKVGVAALHAAALEPQLFQGVKLSRTLVSWSNVIHNRLNHGQVINLVHGALAHYDLPDLKTVLGNKLTAEQPVDTVDAVIPDSR